MSQNNMIKELLLLICIFCFSVMAFAQLPDTAANIQHIQSKSSPVGLSASDWVSIQNQIKTGKYKAYPHDNGNYHASNPAHGWQIVYAEDGTTTLSPHRRNAEPYHLALKLNAIGYGALEFLDHPKSISRHENTLDYHWNAILTERWVNSETDLEQWFYLNQRPTNTSSEHMLTLNMTLDSTLSIRQNGNTILFTGPSGTEITYNKLKVWDAEGRQIPTKMQLDGLQLSLLIDDSTAQYPLTIDPSFQQRTYLKASNTDANDNFGSAVAVSGDTVVIGSPRESSSATGINGNQNDNSVFSSGAVYVYTHTNSTWTQQAYIKASNAGESDYFGISVAISENTLVVGASDESSSSGGIDGDQNDDSAFASGAVYVFTRTGNNWSQQAYLKASNPDLLDSFGHSVSIAGETVVVSAINEASNAREVNGNQDDNSAINAGAAYIFTREGNIWSQQAYLKSSNHDANDSFGESVAISGNTIVINALGKAGAYVFSRKNNTWSQQTNLKPSNPDALPSFGSSVAITGDAIIVGANGTHTNPIVSNINDNQGNDLPPLPPINGTGTAYVFTRSDNVWNEVAELMAPDNELVFNFGESVAISGGNIVVGAPNLNKAFLYSGINDNWNFQTTLDTSDINFLDRFHVPIAIDGNIVVIGARNESSNATGINGDQTNNTEPEAGAAYTFTLQSQQPVANQGLWWTPSRPGSGFDIGINSNNDLYMIWYTYTNDDQPIWYLASGSLSGTDWNADLFEFAWDGTNTSSKTVGTAQLSFQDAAHAMLDWTLNTDSGSIAIEHFVFDTGNNVSAGTWFETTWPGYGLTQVNQGNTQVSVLYFYDQAGQPVWTLGSGDLTTTTIAMSSFTGSGPACQFEHSVASSAGTVTASFSGQLNGMLSTDINLSTPLSGTWQIDDVTITNLAGSTQNSIDLSLNQETQ